MDHLNNPKSIKYHVANYLESIKNELNEKIVIDIPAGTGITTRVLSKLGAKVQAFDLFPEYFKEENLNCIRADVTNIPVEDGSADFLICQEGIEHFTDQLKVLKEFNRVLKPGGHLILTTPSFSNLASKFSYLLFESEHNRKMPPNEIDDIWMGQKSINNEIYFGHIFLVGLQKLRVMGRLAGFAFQEAKYVRLSKGSLLLFPFFYPLILVSSYLRYYSSLRKNPGISKQFKEEVYSNQLYLNISPANLLNKHTFVIMIKEKNQDNVNFSHESLNKSFDQVT